MQVNAAGDVNISVREEKTSRKDVDRPAARADAREYRALDETFAVVKCVCFTSLPVMMYVNCCVS